MPNSKNKDNDPMLDFLNKIFELKEIDDIFNLIIKTVQTCVNCKRVSIMIADKNNEYLILKKHTGITDFISENTKVKIEDSFAGQVFRTGEPLIINNMEKYGLIKQYSDYNAFLIYPLILENSGGKKVNIGVINATNKADNRPFTEEDQKFIEKICINSVIAIKDKLNL